MATLTYFRPSPKSEMPKESSTTKLFCVGHRMVGSKKVNLYEAVREEHVPCRVPMNKSLIREMSLWDFNI